MTPNRERTEKDTGILKLSGIETVQREIIDKVSQREVTNNWD